MSKEPFLRDYQREAVRKMKMAAYSMAELVRENHVLVYIIILKSKVEVLILSIS